MSAAILTRDALLRSVRGRLVVDDGVRGVLPQTQQSLPLDLVRGQVPAQHRADLCRRVWAVLAAAGGSH